jgi:uncharacterized OB-fold protein
MTTALPRPSPRRSGDDARFWDYLDRQELRLQRCGRCGRFRYPPGPICPDCWSEEHEWTPLSGRGRLLGWTRFHRQYFPQLPVPYVVAAVQTVEGPILIGNLLGADGLELVHGMECLVVFERALGDDGEFWICQWTPEPTLTTTTRSSA